MNHWFDGLAMLHRFSFADGAVSYANRFLDTKAWRAAHDTGKIAYSEFATDPCRSLFQRVSAMFSPKISDNANVNLVKLGERFIAMTETPIPGPVRRRHAGRRGRRLQGARDAHDRPSAHGSRDQGHAQLRRQARAPQQLQVLPAAARRERSPRCSPRKAVREPAYMHSFGLTPRWLVLAEFPFVVNPLRLAFSGRPYIENYRWRPELGTRFHLFDRTNGQSVGPFETEARFGFHHVNSYEEDGEVVVDIITVRPTRRSSRTSTSSGCARASRSRRHTWSASGSLPGPAPSRASGSPRSRWSCRESTTGAATSGPIATRGASASAGGWLDRIVKADVVASGRPPSGREDGCYPGEAVFVARARRRARGRGRAAVGRARRPHR